MGWFKTIKQQSKFAIDAKAIIYIIAVHCL